MKTILPLSLGLWLAVSGAPAQSGSRVPAAPPEPTAARQFKNDHTITERGPHHRVWERTELLPAPDGTTVEQVRCYVELATGLHYAEPATGEWRESREEIEAFAEGAVARHGPHKVIFAPNLATAGAIEVEMPNGGRLRSHVLGLSYFDTASGRSVLIAEVKDADGEILPPNQVIYRNAFTDLKADVCYTYTLAGFQQDVILRSSPPSPEAYGLDPATTRLQVLTEFIDPPAPRKVPREQEGLADEGLDFGDWHVVPGRAFPEDADEAMSRASLDLGRSVPVVKHWLELEGRNFLVEEVVYPAVREELEALPLHEGAAIPPADGGIRHTVSGTRLLPARPKLAALDAGPKPMQMAQAALSAPAGYVIDYSTINGSLTNHMFRGDMTYYVSGPVYLYGANTVEGGTVVKYAQSANAQLHFYGTLDCRTAPYRPAVFTARDDNSVGEMISGSTGNPSGLYAYAALRWGSPATALELHDLRVAYAHYGLLLFPGGNHTHIVRDSQFCRNSTSVYADYTTGLLLRNLLVQQTGTRAVYGVGSTVRAEHLTIHQAHRAFEGGTVSVTNSLLVWVTNWPTAFTSVNNATNNDSATFQTVGAGAHYLAAQSPYRNAGTTNLHPDLLGDLKWQTTYPPAGSVQRDRDCRHGTLAHRAARYGRAGPGVSL